MRFFSKVRASLLVCGAMTALAACSPGADIVSPGGTNPPPPPGGGGGGGGGATCPAGTTNGGALGSLTVCNITGEILADLTIPNLANIVYRLNGRVDVGRDVGGNGTAPGGQAAELRINPGVRLFGAASGDVLIVNRGSRLIARGNVNQPIIFTARQDIEGTISNPDTATRLWAGVVIAGRAPLNNCNTAVTAGSADCQNQVEGILASTGRNALYGGASPNDNSGELEFVQIRYPGAFLPGAAAGDDLNGLTLAGVGSGTLINRVQIHNSGDDGMEIFGGTVNIRNFVVTGAIDDSLDFDDGWNGNAQFVVVRQTPAGEANAPDRLVESSNRRSGAVGGPNNPTNPTIANFTFLGLLQNSSASALTNGLNMNNTGGTPGSSGRYYNGVVTGPTRCVTAAAAATSPAPVFNSVLFDCPTLPDAATQALIDAGTNNSTTVPNTLAGLFPGPNEAARTPFNVTSLGAFFQSAPYIGAFADTETETNSWATGWTFRLFPDPECPAGTLTGLPINGQRRCILTGTLGVGAVPANLTLTSNNLYEIQGRVDVGVDRGGAGTSGVAASLTIESGTRLFADSGSDVIIVNRGSQIFVEGTQNRPVIMTAARDILGTLPNKAQATREWAGLVIAGRAPLNNCNAAVTAGSVDCQNPIEGILAATGANALYGGATPTDNSGTIRYLSIRFPGAFLPGAAAGDDLNGLTLGGVGSGTIFENVQIHNSGDDGIEIFGGTTNLRNVVVTGAIDDSLDFDDGWNGNVQRALVIQSTAGEANAPDRLVESSNRRSGAVLGPNTPTNPQVVNFTFLGLLQNSSASALTNGLNMNNTGGTPGSSGRYYNGVVTGPTRCVTAAAAATSPAPTFQSVLFDCPTLPDAATQALIDAGSNNSTTVANSLIGVVINGATESARTAVNPTTLGSFFLPLNYIGAVQNGSDTWYQGWTCGPAPLVAC